MAEVFAMEQLYSSLRSPVVLGGEYQGTLLFTSNAQ